MFEVDSRLVVGLPQSRASKRTVAIPAGIVPDLRAHLAKFAEKGTTGRVFVGPRGATLRRTSFQPTWRKPGKNRNSSLRKCAPPSHPCDRSLVEEAARSRLSPT
jgi:hypothetical protein